MAAAVAVLLAAQGGVFASVPKISKPSIVFVLADDLGYNEMGFMNGTRGLISPNLDALAHSGVILKNYYVQPICSPTRSALMTGRYTIRLGTQSNVIYWDTPWGVPANETFLPQNLQDAGYHTAMFGKWHLGMFMEKYTPMGRGFDEHMGYYQGCESAYTHIAACCRAGSPDADQGYVCQPGGWNNYSHTKKDYRGYDWFKSGFPNKGLSVPDFSANHTNSATLIKEAGIEFINRAKSMPKPFFLYLPFQNIHGPYTCDAEFRNMYSPSRFTDDERTMFGYMTEMDHAVGAIINAFNSTVKYQNSVVIFSSDNGAPPASEEVNHKQGDKPGWIARNYPMRGWKTLIWEGGTRVAGFIHSPLLPKQVQGTVSYELYHVTDWLPTIVGFSGGSTSRNFALDGHDMWPSLSTGTLSPRTEMLYNVNPLCDAGQAGAPKAALRMNMQQGAMKLMSWCYEIAGVAGGTVTRPVNCPANSAACDAEFKKGPVLYNLTADIGERINIAGQNPDIVQKMLARLKTLAEESVEPQQWTKPYQGSSYFCADCPLHPAGRGAAVPWSPWCEDNVKSGEPCKPRTEQQMISGGSFDDQQNAHQEFSL